MSKLKVNNLNNILMPAHITDSGYDIIAASDPVIVGLKVDGIEDKYYSIDYIEYDTELSIEPPMYYHTYVFPRSSISKMNLVLCNSVGLIDQGYRGSIKLRFKYIAQPIDSTLINGHKQAIGINKNKIYKMGDKIGQLVLASKVVVNIEQEDNLSQTTRNAGGFGSTGS
jgi:dUTPase